jgi:hypothetical protein
MSRTLIILCLFINALVNAQGPDNLFIKVAEDKSICKLKSSDGISVLESYTFSLNTEDLIKKVLVRDDKGNVRITTMIIGKSLPTFRILYFNEKGTNEPIKVVKQDLANVLDLADVIKLTDAERLIATIKQFKNIYLVEIINDQWFAKKVKFESVPTL